MSLPPSSPSPVDDEGYDSSREHRARTMRKKEQEKRRRNDFKDSLNTLHETLLLHDEIFHQESQKRERRLANKKDQDYYEPGILGNQPFFNRVEIINQAAFTLNRIMEENKALRAVIDNSNQGCSDGHTHIQEHSQKSDMKPVVGFHEGVGPVLMVPDRENRSVMGSASSNPSLATSISTSTAHRFSQSLMPLTGISSVLPEHRRQALGEDLLLNPFRQHQDMPLAAGYSSARVLGNQRQDPSHMQLQSFLSFHNAQSFPTTHRQPLVVPSPALSFPAMPATVNLLQDCHPILNYGRSAPAGMVAILQDPTMPTVPTVFPSQDSPLEYSRRAARGNRSDNSATEVYDDTPRRKRKRPK